MANADDSGFSPRRIAKNDNAGISDSRSALEVAVRASDALFAAANRDELIAATTRGSNALGLGRVLLSCGKKIGPELILDSTFTTFRTEFLEVYDRWHEADPMVARIAAGERAVSWNTARDRFPDSRQNSYMDYLRSMGVGGGILVSPSYHGDTASLFIMGSDREHRYGPDTMLAASFLGSVAMAKAEILGLSRTVSADEAIALRLLSDVQREVLNWIAEGKSNLDIALIMNLGERAIRYHVGQILQKLGVATRQQAAVICRTAGRTDPTRKEAAGPSSSTPPA
ncbi:MAG: LuxR family transcriptional regulator [Novosphingobium sp.]|jgi:LuxR family transcriptional regulator|nr:LuxR family transcriptional regulator [Novosphingobium sp.]